MAFLDSPKNYNECLAKLNKATFLTTLVFFICLRLFGLIPKVELTPELIPPIKDHKELLEWALSFGVIPLIAAILAFFASHTFELHNKVAWRIGVRPFWSSHFILRPLKQRGQWSHNLTAADAKLVMNDLYYAGIKKIDEHHVHLFWRYATQFWVLFEHVIIVFVTAVAVSILSWRTSVLYLWLYFFVMSVLAALHLFFVAGPRSTKQAEEIPSDIVHEFFTTHFRGRRDKENG